MLTKLYDLVSHILSKNNTPCYMKDDIDFIKKQLIELEVCLNDLSEKFTAFMLGKL